MIITKQLTIMLSCLLLAGCLPEDNGIAANSTGTITTSVEQDFGIDIESARLTAAGYMIDFRYRVTDPAKAFQALSRRTKPYLVDKETGAKLVVPNSTKIGPLKQTTLEPEANRVYFMLFGNTSKVIKRGSKVDVFIGDFVAKDIVVQ